MWAQWDLLVLRDGLLHRQWESGDGRQSHLQLVVPHSLTHDVLPALHDDPSAGHLGMRKTLHRVRQRFYWPGMSRDVEEWCRQCERCASHKSGNQTRRAPLLTSSVGYPIERVATDTMGLLPVTDRKNRYILVL